MNRLIFIILAIGIASTSAQAKPFKYFGGAGTIEDPYRIASAGDLLELRSATSDYDANFVVIADINLSSSGVFTTAIIAPDTNNANWDFDGYAFTGVFDGNGYTISNLTINTAGAGNDYLGLFGYIDEAEIKNLQLTEVRITGGNESRFLGGLVGKTWNWAVINNCSSTGIVSGGDYATCIGGLVGSDRCVISDCSSSVAVIGGNHSQYIGGLLGDCYVINNCYSTGNVRAGNYSYCVGGFAGENVGPINNCRSTGNVTAGTNSYSIGGFAGQNYRGETSKSFSTGNVTTGNDSGHIGGFVGKNEEGSIVNCYSTGWISAGARAQYIGGLAGYNYDSSIVNSYSISQVGWGDSSSYIGGLVGLNSLGVLTNSYFDYTISGPANGYGEPLTDDQMKQQASFVGWDFAGEKKNGKEDIWAIEEGVDYPKLNWVKVFKCAVTAGKDNKDKIAISGQLDTTANYYFTNGNFIEITVKSDHMPNYWDHYFEITNENFKNGKLNYNLNSVKGFKTSLKYDTKTRKFAYSAGNVDLSGLDCPVTYNIHIGDYHGSVDIDEDIVNGKKPAPMILMMGVEDALRVDKIKVKQSTKPNSDQLTVSGEFAMGNTSLNLADWDFNISLDGEPYTIGAGKLIATKNGFGCKNVLLEDGFSVSSIDFNFKTCKFKITIKKTEIDDGYQGDVDFGIMFGDYEEDVDVVLP